MVENYQVFINYLTFFHGVKNKPAKVFWQVVKNNEISNMTNYAVLIGNSEFPNDSSLKSLSCPEKDVLGMKAVLTAENHGLFLADNVCILHNQNNSNIFEELEKVLDTATKNDLVLIYYSGHGLQDRLGNLCLSTHNTRTEVLKSTAVSFNRLYAELIKTSYCKKIIIILDCCYSGLAGVSFKDNITSQLQSLNNQITGAFLITACSDNEVAQDRNANSEFSLFTKHLIGGLETGAADNNGDGLISIDELFRYVSKKVQDEQPAQKPKRFVNNETGEMIIAKSGRGKKRATR